jgi:5-methylcytosine-specific restriction endonuclease McrA
MAESRSKGRTGRPYRRLRTRVIAEEDVCFRCGQPVDKSLPGTHRWGPSLEHKVPLSRGGDPLTRENVALSHLGCNAGYRDGRRITLREVPRRRYSPSRAW